MKLYRQRALALLTCILWGLLAGPTTAEEGKKKIVFIMKRLVLLPPPPPNTLLENLSDDAIA